MSHKLNLVINEDVFRIYMITTSILVAKMLLMSPLTSRQRLAKKIFANPEDATYFPPQKDGKIVLNDPDVERVRRAHLNDLENISPYFIISSLYILSNPTPLLATSAMILYVVSRIAYTYVYAVSPKPQPARVLCWSVTYAITAFMAFRVFISFVN